MSMLTKDEKLRVFNNDRSVRDGSTYADHAAAVPTPGGRFASHQAPPTIIKGGPDYPQISGGPWSEPCPTGDEPPLGYSVSAAPDLGEPLPTPTNPRLRRF
jgi:hypothetical protein